MDCGERSSVVADTLDGVIMIGRILEVAVVVVGGGGGAFAVAASAVLASVEASPLTTADECKSLIGIV